MKNKVDQTLLDKIEALGLSENNLSWREAMRAAGYKVYADRMIETGGGNTCKTLTCK